MYICMYIVSVQLDEWIWSASIRMCFVNQSRPSRCWISNQIWHVSSRDFVCCTQGRFLS